MSDFRAIAGVSATLQSLLRDRMELPAGMTPNSLRVTISTPMAETPQGAAPVAETLRVNLFLYQVSESPFLKNQDVPGRGHPAAYGSPPLSLNLHYLLTAYGSTAEASSIFFNETQAQLLLGSAMRVLHDFPQIGDGMLTQRLPGGEPILHPSLRGEYERLKLCLDPLSIEDLSKIWTALTVPYRASAAYSVSVVRIESRRTRRYPQLVGEPSAAGPMISVIPLQTPQIDSFTVRRPGDEPVHERAAPYARLGDTLIIHGQAFNGGVTVSINGLDIPVKPLSPQRIELVLPDESFTFDGRVVSIPLDERLQPGVQSIEVRAAPPGMPRASARSNRAAFMLVPLIQTIVSTPARAVTLTGVRIFAPDLEGETLIGPALYSSDAYDTASPTSVTITLTDAFPHRAARAYVTDQILQAQIAALTTPPQVEVTIGSSGPQTVVFPRRPADLEGVAQGLQTAIRSATSGGRAFTEARVAVADGRLVVLPGGLLANVTIGGAGAGALSLQTGTMREGYLSGALDPFPALSAPPGAVHISVGGAAATATLATTPTSVATAASALQAAIRGASANAAFTGALVAALGSQLLIVPSAAGSIAVVPMPGGDQTTTAELKLRASYPVRLRVNGAEALGGANSVELPL